MSATVFGGIHNFFQSATWNVVQSLGTLFLVVFWIATIFWVRKDALRRIENQRWIWLSTVLGAIPPFLGPLIYMLFRPPEYIEDVRERNLEIKAIEQRLGAGECPTCHAEVQADYLVCPICTTKLRQPCTTCLRPIDPAWHACPYCEMAIPHPEVIEPVEIPEPVAVEETVEIRPRTAVQPGSSTPG